MQDSTPPPTSPSFLNTRIIRCFQAGAVLILCGGVLQECGLMHLGGASLMLGSVTIALGPIVLITVLGDE